MPIHQRLKDEVRSLLLVTVYFAGWLLFLMLIKVLLLAEYQIVIHRWSAAIVGALVLAKVVLVMDHVSLGRWIAARPAWIVVLIRTVLYSVGVCVVLVVEHGIAHRHQDAGFIGAVTAALHVKNAPHVAVNTMCVTAALLIYNSFAVVQHSLGSGVLRTMFLKPVPRTDATR